jgi:predicted nucleotidyltransferase
MPEESWDTVRVIWLDREAAREAVRGGAKGLVACRPEVHKVVLFGSLARGDAVPGSDADVLIVAETDVRFIDRYLEYIEYFDQSPVDVELFVYTPQEAEAMAREPTLVRTALREGIVLAERSKS